MKPESSNDDEDLSGIADLEEEVRQLLEGKPDIGLELVSAGTTGSNSTSGAVSFWYRRHYPLHRRPSLRVQADLKRRESDKERQLQDEPLLKKSGQGHRAQRENV